MRSWLIDRRWKIKERRAFSIAAKVFEHEEELPSWAPGGLGRLQTRPFGYLPEKKTEFFRNGIECSPMSHFLLLIGLCFDSFFLPPMITHDELDSQVDAKRRRGRHQCVILQPEHTAGLQTAFSPERTPVLSWRQENAERSCDLARLLTAAGGGGGGSTTSHIRSVPSDEVHALSSF